MWFLKKTLLVSLLIVCNRVKCTKAKKPNILLILADDVGMGDIGDVYWETADVDTSSSTGKVLAMNNIAELASKGVVFSDMHSTPLCAPSRYALLTGNYVHRGRRAPGTWNIATGKNRNQLFPRQKSIAQVLRDGGGYHTAMMGKWHIGATVPKINDNKVNAQNVILNENVDWNLPLRGGPQDLGFQSSLMTAAGIQAPPYVFFRDDYLNSTKEDIIFYQQNTTHPRPQGISMIDFKGEGDKDWDSTAYNMVLVNETERFIDSHLSSTRQDDPFFAYVALGSVHLPHSPPYSYLDGSPVDGEYESKHMDLLGELDKIVGSLLEILETRNLLEDTVIIFTSDNGGLGDSKEYGHKASGPLRGYKSQIHEGGHRVPMIMRWDGVFPSGGEKRDYHLSLTDIFATLCEIADIDVPENQAVDSVSFANYIYDVEDTSSLRTYLGTWRYKDSALLQESIRKGSFKLIKHNWDSAIELFDLKEDISESIDLASNLIHSSLIDEMLNELAVIGPGVHFGVGKWGIGADSSWKFNLLPKKEAKFEQSCDWFARKNTHKRCARYKRGRLRCTYTCAEDSVSRLSVGPNTSSISPLLPSSSPSREPP